MAFPSPVPATRGRAANLLRAPSAGSHPSPKPPAIPQKPRHSFLLQANPRIEETRYIVPILADIARREHNGKTRRIVAVLAAWGDLAGVTGWSEEMIDIVAEALR